MSKTVFSDFGIEIIEREATLYIRYDAGGIVAQMREDVISEAEANRAMKSENDAYHVLLAIERRLIASGVDPHRSNF